LQSPERAVAWSASLRESFALPLSHFSPLVSLFSKR
jgi:hypothetical protein